MTIYTASMPSNIALIKYMGKKNSDKNIPSNSSLSYTLPNLITTVILRPIDSNKDTWKNYLLTPETKLSDSEKTKFIKHLDFLRTSFNIKQYYEIESLNNFPANCGLASSASSFAALTACAIKAFNLNNITIEQQAILSQQGSGSSCRSFFSPWTLWNDKNISNINLPYNNLIHNVIVVSQEKKSVSSREAHTRVMNSLLFSDREKRAENRLENLLNNFSEKNWKNCYEIIWQEFWDMHALFETSHPAFGYLLPDSLLVLNTLRNYWQQNNDGPLITMDAGPNIHLLFRSDQISMAENIKENFQQKYLVL